MYKTLQARRYALVGALVVLGIAVLTIEVNAITSSPAAAPAVTG